MRLWGRKLYGAWPTKPKKGIPVKTSEYKSYDDLPLFLNAEMVAKVMGVSLPSRYEMMYEVGFPELKVGSRMIVPLEKFKEWVKHNKKEN